MEVEVWEDTPDLNGPTTTQALNNQIAPAWPGAPPAPHTFKLWNI